MDDTSASHFFKALAGQLTSDNAFVERLAVLMAKHLGASGSGAVAAAIHSAASAAAAPRKRGRPRKNAAPAKPAAKASAPAKKGSGAGSPTDRVLAAVRAGANTKRDIVAKSGVSDAGYDYAMKVLKERGAIRVEGIKRMARIMAN